MIQGLVKGGVETVGGGCRATFATVNETARFGRKVYYRVGLRPIMTRAPPPIAKGTAKNAKCIIANGFCLSINKVGKREIIT